MLTQIYSWLENHQSTLIGFGVVSTALFALSLLILPWLVSKIPTDYFCRSPEHDIAWSELLHPKYLVRNLIGISILLAGLLMLVLPGQGILTILAGIAIMQFPGKFRLEHWLVKRPGVLSALNWLRRKARVPELLC